MAYSAKSDALNTISRFLCRKEVKITTSGTSTPANYQVKCTIDYETAMQSLFQDIRFNTKAGTYIDYWIESKTDSDTAEVWLELPDTITDPGTDTVWMYYGNAAVSDGGVGDDTFEFFDDFGQIIQLIDEPTNPTRIPDDAWESPWLCEQEDFNYNGQYISWYRGGDNSIGYETSSDGITWIPYTGNPILSGNYIHPYIVQDGDNFYMFLKHLSDGNLYLYNVTEHTNPVIMNGGNPVYTHSATTTDWDYQVFNMAVAIVDGVWHMLLEGKTSTSNFKMGYAYSNLTEMNWSAHRSTSFVIDDSGNPDLLYVPERNALLSVHGDYSGSYWKIITSYADLTADLSLSTSWNQSTNFVIEQASIHITDPHVMTNFNATYPIMISYIYDQSKVYQKYSTLTLLEFYDKIVLTYQLTDKWDNPGAGSYSITNGVLAWTGADKRLTTKTAHSVNTAIRTMVRVATQAEVYGGFGYWNTDNQIEVMPSFDVGKGYVAFKKAGAASGSVVMTAASGDVTTMNIWDISRISTTEVLIELKGVTELDYTNTAYIPIVDMYGEIYKWDCNVYVDWFLIHKYIANEPTSDIGTARCPSEVLTGRQNSSGISIPGGTSSGKENVHGLSISGGISLGAK